MKYQIEHTDSANRIIIHTDKKLVEEQTCFPDFLGIDDKGLPKGVRTLARKVWGIPGVTQDDVVGGGIEFNRYKMELTKSPIFEWDEILPEVVKLMATHLNKGAALKEKAPAIPYTQPAPELV